MDLCRRKMRILQMHFFRAGTIGDPIHRHLDYLDARLVNPRHAAFIQLDVTADLGFRHGHTIPCALGGNKAANRYAAVTNARFATLHVLLVVPVPLPTTPVPLRKSRARHERESCVGRKSGGLPSAAGRRPLRSGCDALYAPLRSPRHFPARRPQTEAAKIRASG